MRSHYAKYACSSIPMLILALLQPMIINYALCNLCNCDAQIISGLLMSTGHKVSFTLLESQEVGKCSLVLKVWLSMGRMKAFCSNRVTFTEISEH